MTENPDSPSRTKSGHFIPGQSGNPSGRPRSEIVALRSSLAENSTQIVEIVVAAALGGDLNACKLILDRLVPPLKPSAAAVQLAIPPNATPLAIARSIIEAVAAGIVAPDTASQLVTSIGTLCRIEEVEDLRARIAALEKATQP